MVETFYRGVVRARWVVIAVSGVLAVFMGWRARQLSVESPTTDAFPTTHPFVQTFAKYKRQVRGSQHGADLRGGR